MTEGRKASWTSKIKPGPLFSTKCGSVTDRIECKLTHGHSASRFQEVWVRATTRLSFGDENKRSYLFVLQLQCFFVCLIALRRSGLMVSALDSGASGSCSSPGRGHCVVFLGKTQLSQCLSPSRSINGWGNLTNCGGVTCDRLASHPGGVEILLAAPCYRNWDKLPQL